MRDITVDYLITQVAILRLILLVAILAGEKHGIHSHIGIHWLAPYCSRAVPTVDSSLILGGILIDILRGIQKYRIKRIIYRKRIIATVALCDAPQDAIIRRDAENAVIVLNLIS